MNTGIDNRIIELVNYWSANYSWEAESLTQLVGLIEVETC